MCREYDCYGLYDTKGKCILPVVFLEINHIAKNRIRVVWNLEIVKSWDKDQYEKGNSTYKFHGSGTEYEINQRSALCDSSGTILNDKQYLYVGKFTGKYAKAYNEIKEEKYTLGQKIEELETKVNDLEKEKLGLQAQLEQPAHCTSIHSQNYEKARYMELQIFLQKK